MVISLVPCRGVREGEGGGGVKGVEREQWGREAGRGLEKKV